MPELRASIRSILMEGARIGYNAQQDEIVRLEMYGLIKNKNDTVCVANRIFESNSQIMRYRLITAPSFNGAYDKLRESLLPKA